MDKITIEKPRKRDHPWSQAAGWLGLEGATQEKFCEVTPWIDAVGTVVCVGCDNSHGGDTFYPAAREGLPGNMDANVRKADGWRGNTDGIDRYALGVHRVTRVTEGPRRWVIGLSPVDK